MTFVAKHPMPPEDQAELDAMLEFPNKDGSLGWMLYDGEEAVHWHVYYKLKRPHKARALKERVLDGKPYMVPTQWPEWYDRSYAPIRKPTAVTLRDPPMEITPEARERVLALFEKFKLRWAEPTQKAPPETPQSLEEKLQEKGKALAEAFKNTDFSKLMVEK